MGNKIARKFYLHYLLIKNIELKNIYQIDYNKNKP